MLVQLIKCVGLLKVDRHSSGDENSDELSLTKTGNETGYKI